jgi:error-prone DNA polymerase
MGFYQPAQIVRDAADHGVEVRPVDVNLSDWDCTLEPVLEADARVQPGHDGSFKHVMAGLDPAISRKLALRLGFRQVKGLAEAEIAKLVAARGAGYRSAEQLWRRAGLDPRTLARMAEADAFRSLGLDRRQALWAVKGLGEAPLPLFAAQAAAAVEENETDKEINLPEMPLSQHVIEDYRSMQLSLKRHPMTFLRDRLAGRGILSSQDLSDCRNGQRVQIAGLVLVRQRPGTASGIIFMTLEDETGIANLVVWKHMFQKFRRTVMTAKLVACEGRLQIEGLAPHQVIHVVAERLIDLTHLLGDLREDAKPLRRSEIHKATMPVPVARADAVMHPLSRPDPRDGPIPNGVAGEPVLDIRSRDFH